MHIALCFHTEIEYPTHFNESTHVNLLEEIGRKNLASTFEDIDI